MFFKANGVFALALLISSLFFSCQMNSSSNAFDCSDDGEIAHRCLKNVTDIMVHDITNPPLASKNYAYTSLAYYEASRHADPNLVSLAGQLNELSEFPEVDQDKEYCFTLSAVVAFYMVAEKMLFSTEKLDATRDELITELEADLPKKVTSNSKEFGTKIANHILEWTKSDGYAESRTMQGYVPEKGSLSAWRPTPPDYLEGIEPNWNTLRPFFLDSVQQFKPLPPPAYDANQESVFWKDLLEVYEVVNNLTPEETEIAQFWDCNPFATQHTGHLMFGLKKISPGGHWMGISTIACRQKGLSSERSAEVYVRVALSLADYELLG